MKIESITFVKDEDVPVHRANTDRAKMIDELVAQLAKAPQSHQNLEVNIKGEIKKWYRYALQKSLLKAGAKGVRVTMGKSRRTGHEALFIVKGE